MATREQVEKVLEKMERLHAANLLKSFDDVRMGMGAVLRLLHESEETVTAGRISGFMGVSTARVAALLNKMAARGLITRESHANDARITVVRLTPLGEKTVTQMKDGIYRQAERVIDRVGEKRLMEFFDTADEIQSVVSPPEIDL